jgi:hypothetical protein
MSWPAALMRVPKISDRSFVHAMRKLVPSNATQAGPLSFEIIIAGPWVLSSATVFAWIPAGPNHTTSQPVVPLATEACRHGV